MEEEAMESNEKLAEKGLEVLDETIEAGHQILFAMNEELCNPSFWSTTSNASASASASVVVDGSHDDSSNQGEIGGESLEISRIRFKSAVASLRSVLTDISDSQKAKESEVGTTAGESESQSDQAEIKKLEEQAANLRKELAEKNKILKSLIDQFRELITDISSWQSPCSLKA